ncbi:helical backbone metal receptor [Mitsuaria sp. GD03876]|uniref:helical backbone metal receptor n=1 Tax=Mitsuaria sp. GD03876 TaxID=2975399 RepID=UPI00244AF84E|nr:helical backbone metal receptor [Mitsuaria sp. GD03876]MDH0867427.1 helical backbone metal receptor [Mitsuaria sp. GD03876]
MEAPIAPPGAPRHADGLRVVSLVPSVTELLFALGLGPWIVGRTGFCIHPAPAVSAISKIGGTKDVQLDKLRALAPTHVVVNVDENRLDTVEALRAFVPHVVVTHPCGPEDNLTLVTQMVGMVEVFAAELGVRSEPPGRNVRNSEDQGNPPPLPDVPDLRDRAARLAAELREELAACRAFRSAPRQGPAAPRVLYLIWRDPWMTVARDTYIARMLAEVGWHSWPPVEGGESGAARYPVLAGEEPWLAEIDELLLSSEPYRFDERHLAEARALCPNARVRLVDGELVSWYGPRAAEGLRYLRGLARAPR